MQRITQRRYGPYFVYPDFQRRLEFEAALSFELMIVAYRDPHVTPERMLTRGMLNGIAIVYHADDHHSVVLDSHGSTDRVRLERPTDAQRAEFHRLAALDWLAFRDFCVSSPLTRHRWRQPEVWGRLREPRSADPNERALPLFDKVIAGLPR